MSQVVGFARWEPKSASIELVLRVKQILKEYEDYLPLTGRQIFYRLVGAFGYEKTELAYKRLLDKLNRARRAGMIPFESIRDDGTTHYWNRTWDGPSDFVEWLPGYVKKTYRRDRQDGQAQRLEVWVEAAGMVPQAYNVAWEFGIEVYSSGGFNSTTMKHEAAQRIVEEWESNRRPTKVLHVGDHDPSGVAIFENLEVDIPAMVAGVAARTGRIRPGGKCAGRHIREWVSRSSWRRIAVTEEQISRYSLEEAPPKKTDSRSATWDGGTVQVEAMSPQELAGEIRRAIESEMDEDPYSEVRGRERDDLEALVPELERLLEDYDG